MKVLTSLEQQICSSTSISFIVKKTVSILLALLCLMAERQVMKY